MVENITFHKMKIDLSRTKYVKNNKIVLVGVKRTLGSEKLMIIILVLIQLMLST